MADIPQGQSLTRAARHKGERRSRPLDLYQVVVECRDEEEQRLLYERLRQMGLKVRLLVL